MHTNLATLNSGLADLYRSLESSTKLVPFNNDTIQFLSNRRYFFTSNLQLLADNATQNTGWLGDLVRRRLDPTPDEQYLIRHEHPEAQIEPEHEPHPIRGIDS